jgi:hypothetical protein
MRACEGESSSSKSSKAKVEEVLVLKIVHRKIVRCKKHFFNPKLQNEKKKLPFFFLSNFFFIWQRKKNSKNKTNVSLRALAFRLLHLAGE